MGKLIFFVDDDRMILNLLEYTFKSREDYQVNSYRSGEDCIVALDLNPDLIVLDHSFKNVGSKFEKGLDILIHIKTLRPEIPIIMLSGSDDEELMNQYLKNGASKFITKDSYFIDSLSESIENVLVR